MANTTRRRYEIFVGSTFKELKDARQQIIEAILLAGHIPCGTELWPAEPQAPAGVIQDYLYPCDIHVLIVGHRYGSLVPKNLIPKEQAPKRADWNVSFTHWEYLQSLENKRPLIVFLQEEDEVIKARAELQKDDPDSEHDEKFRQFRDELKKQNNFMLVRFSNTDFGRPKLGGQCIAAISRLTNSGFLPSSSGWIRADSRDAETLRAIEGNAFLKRAMDQIRQFEILADRVTQNIGAKEAMAQHFWFFMQSRIRDWSKRISKNGSGAKRSWSPGKNLFFESGSSIAYVAKEFEQAVLDEAGIREDWHIRTNNILCLLQFDLHTTIDGRCFPDGKPDPADKYGAIFPDDWGVLHREPPIKPRLDLSSEEKRAVRKLRTTFQRHGPTFVLATTSGWDTDSPDLEFRGPHVGSHKNMLFKRVIFTTDYPVVLFLDAEKLGYKRQRNCYPVFGPDLPMTDWLEQYPVAVCIGWEWPKVGTRKPGAIPLAECERRNNAEYVRSLFSNLGFNVEFFCEESINQRSEVRTGAILLANKNFCDQVPLLQT